MSGGIINTDHRGSAPSDGCAGCPLYKWKFPECSHGSRHCRHGYGEDGGDDGRARRLASRHRRLME